MINNRVAVIGAGSSGIAACRVLAERGIPFDCFEKGSDVGGLWRYENDNGLGSAYASLHTNTSRETTRFASHPMPAGAPDFLHHTQMLSYLEDYVEHFGFRDKIRFRTEVTEVKPVADAWEVRSRDAGGAARGERYTAVLVASGHHWNPRPLDPPLPGTFAGRELHSHTYRTAEGFEDRNVLVVGIGDSAMDIACDTSRVAKMTFLTARRGAWIIPKYLGSKPLDEVAIGRQSRFPIAGEVASGALLKLGSKVFARKIDVIYGRPEDHGLPKPDHEFGQGIATGSSEIYTRVGLGRVTPKPWISRLDGERVCFADGSVEQIDAIVYCTGYKITLPFLSEQLIDPKDNQAPLYKRVVHPDLPGLYFIGLIDVAGPVNPLSELQSEWVADLLQGTVELPSSARMKQAVAREDRKRQKRFGGPGKHAIHVDYVPYLHTLQRERKRRGGRRGGASDHSSQRNPTAAGAGASGLEGNPSAGTGSL
jgi:dimethylaniline monooxygenase (N-oxide forming)